MKPEGPAHGAWREPGTTIRSFFQPSGAGFPLGRRPVHLRLPEAIQVISGSDPSRFRTLSWQVPRGSLLRMKQMLADLGYLPLSWQPSGEPVRLTASAQVRAAVDPPAGSFTWRYGKTPGALKALWSSENERPVIVRGAIMAFESKHGMTTDGFPSMSVFRALLRDELAGRHAQGGYSYVYVTETLPETLTLWHDCGQHPRTLVNTGGPGSRLSLTSAPFPVWYLHLWPRRRCTDESRRPHYANDPGGPWVN